VAKIEWGTKRICQNCETRFYDLKRTPITCPKCGTVYESQTTTRSRRGKQAVVEEPAKVVKDELEMEIEDTVVLEESGEDAEEGLIEDTSDLGGDLDDMSEVIEHVEAEE
jgi:uncharacterized protein (TIGR02300 family)